MPFSSHCLSVSLDAMFVVRFVAAAFCMVAERATLLHKKLHSKVVQQRSGASSALIIVNYIWTVRSFCDVFLFFFVFIVLFFVYLGMIFIIYKYPLILQLYT